MTYDAAFSSRQVNEYVAISTQSRNKSDVHRCVEREGFPRRSLSSLSFYSTLGGKSFRRHCQGGQTYPRGRTLKCCNGSSTYVHARFEVSLSGRDIPRLVRAIYNVVYEIYMTEKDCKEKEKNLREKYAHE